MINRFQKNVKKNFGTMKAFADYYGYNYQTIKIRIWRGQIDEELVEQSKCKCNDKE